MPTEKEIGDIVRKTFEIYDKDKSGFLEIDELRRMWDDAAQELGLDEEIDEGRIRQIVASVRELSDNPGPEGLSYTDLSKVIGKILKSDDMDSDH